MADEIESAEDLVARVFAREGLPAGEVEHSSLGRDLVCAIRADRAATRRKALIEAADEFSARSRKHREKAVACSIIEEANAELAQALAYIEARNYLTELAAQEPTE